ncbi:MAG: histidinol-phosphate transaminase [Acidobacteriota bacterium]
MNPNGETSFDLESMVRPNVLTLEPYHSAREKVLEGVLLDANENPYRREWDGVCLNRYPDPFQRQLRCALADSLGVGMESIAAGVGSDEVLEWIFKVFCQPGVDSVVTAEPTYGMYQVTAKVFGVDCHCFPLNSAFDFDARAFLSVVPRSAKVLFLCSPNNPTGNLLDREQVRIVCREWPRIVVVDEAYIDFADHGSVLPDLRQFANLIILRTFSKGYGRAAVRLGYALASPDIIRFFLKVKTPYNLSALTMRLGCLALADRESREKNIRLLRLERERISLALRRLPGVAQVFPSDANFILFRCRQASSVVDRLFEKGIVVRDRSSVPGLADCIRVSVGTPAENTLFLDELGKLVGGDRT